MTSYPRSERDARARCRRKLAALANRVNKDLYAIAGMFEEGPVSADVDRLLLDFENGVDALNEAMNDEVDRAAERMAT